MQPRMSVFTNVTPSSFKGHFTVEEVLKTIRSIKFKPQTDYLRTLTDSETARVYKAGKQDLHGKLIEPGHFYGVTWSGRFEGGKKAQHLQEHSNLICIDVDGLSSNHVATLCGKLRADEYTCVLFISPSGNGIKWVVKVNLQNTEDHKAFFHQLSDYLHDNYNLTRKEDVPKGTKPEIDPSGCNVDRLCFLPYDPDAFHNPDSEVMPLLEEYQLISDPVNYQETKADKLPLMADLWPIEDDTNQRLQECVLQLYTNKIDLTANRADWIQIGFALASLGEHGRTYYHEVSQLYHKYDYQETDNKFSELLRNRNGNVKIGTFFHYVEEALGKWWEESSDSKRYSKDAGAKFDHQTASDIPHEWPTPQPIKTSLLAVLPLTPDMLPEPLRPWLCDVADRMKCPLDFVASAAVVMLSSLIGTRLTIKPKTRDDWTVVPNLWGAVIGGPSAMKTPSINEVIKPLDRLVFAAHEEFEDKLRVYAIAQLEYEAQKKAYSSQLQDKYNGKTVANPVTYPQAPEKPKERRFMVNDTTVEKLAELMNENPTGLLHMRDELTGLLAAWDRAGHEQDRAFHLEAWNGNGSMTIDRIARGTTYVKVICESLFGGIQPTKLLPYLKAATGYENDGFVQRLQVAVFPNPARWEYGDQYPDKPARDKAFKVIQQIADSDFKAIGYDADEFEKFPYTRFDAEAQGIFKQWLTEWETRVLPKEGGLLLEHFTKYRSLMPSLALIFHVINCAEDSQPLPNGAIKYFVSAQATQMAVHWCEYLQSHARRIYGLLDTTGIESAKELLQHLRKGDLKDGFKIRDVYRKQWTGLKTVEEAEAAVSELQNRHYLEEIQPPPKGGRPEAPSYLINPQIY